MPITYDITYDLRYIEGVTVGEQNGLSKGIEQGIEQGLLLAVQKVIIKFPHFSDGEIADIFELDVQVIEHIRASI